MTCAFVFRELANRNRFIQDLEDQGYHLDFVGGYIVIYGLPYLRTRRTRTRGLGKPVHLSADGVLDAPKDHQAWFRGSRPHDQNGRQLRLGGGANKVKVTERFETDHSFSYKLLDGAGQPRGYESFEEKVLTYLDTITGPALAAYPEATPLRALEIKTAEQGTPLRLPDTLSAKYRMNDVSTLLVGKRVAIVGLGGTGSYILDFVARTHLAEIALFDDDKVHVHTLFRFPGFIPKAIGMLKVEALLMQYWQRHGNIAPFPERITDINIEKLRGFDFAFLALDHGPSRIFIADWISANDIPFVDCGMGLIWAAVGLNGVVRVTGVGTAPPMMRLHGRPFCLEEYPEGGEYRKQGQIAELNALNAALAVVRFKQHFQIYDREDTSASIILETSTYEVDKTWGVE